MRVNVLGAVSVEVAGVTLDLGTRKQRALMTALALTPGRAVSADALVELIWGDDAPPGVSGTLQAYVAGLRRALEPDRVARAAPTVLVTRPPGYALAVADDALDAVRFEQGVARARELLGRLTHDPVPPQDAAQRPSAEDVAHARGLLTEVGRMWRGTPYLELADTSGVVAERARLDDLHLAAKELEAVARLAEGDHQAVAAELEALTSAHPLRERLWALRAVALTRAGRQADALAALRDVRGVLADELGIDPGEELRRVESAVLRQDPVLAWHPAPATTPPVPSTAHGDGPPPAPPAPAPGHDSGALPAATGLSGPHRSGRDGGADGQGPTPMHRWPLVGRREALDALDGLLRRAEGGEPQFAALVGEPGIGKSRLCAELASTAARRGVRVLIGRCSQDLGAPALWPWAGVLGGLPDAPSLYDELARTGRPGSDDVAGEHFYTWDAICRAVLDAASREPLCVVLDDLHWADASSLRVLRHLASTADRGRLLVVTTWRPHPPPAGALAETAEALARRHALRLDLPGLSAEEAAELFATVAGTAPSSGDATALRRRTDGNPFYLVEYARLLEESADAGETLTAHPPAAVTDVLNRRLAGLPDTSLRLVRIAAALGRTFELTLLATVAERDEDAVLDDLDPALSAGLLVEDGVDRFRFAHALVRDAAYEGMPLSRRARVHARAAAALSTTARAETQADIARHWLASGPAHAARAWPTAVDAADQARRVHAYEEARDLLRAALTSQRDDPAAGWLDRYDLLMAISDTCRLLADWAGLGVAADEAVALAEGAGDPERAATAAVAPSEGALWQPHGHGETEIRVVAALRRALESLPSGDGALRCRVMLALASELYYSYRPFEREALCEQALEMARRLGDQALLLHALQATFTATWRPATAPARLLLAEEAFEVATREGDERAVATALTLHAAAHGELGDPQQMWPLLGKALEQAASLRMPYLLIVLDATQVPWLAMAGRHAEAEEALARLITLAEHATLPQAWDGVAGAALALRLFQGRHDDARQMAIMLAETSRLPVTSTVTAVLLRVGDEQAARDYLDEHSAELDLDRDDWFSLLNCALAGEAALHLGRPELGAEAYARISPYAGRTCVAGSGAAIGPVDAFLALAAAATGELAIAAGHADRALQQCQEWEIPLVAQWLRDQRDRYGF